MMQILSPLIGQFIGQLLMPKAPAPSMQDVGAFPTMQTMPQQQNVGISAMLGSVLSGLLGAQGGGMFGGMSGAMGGFGNPFGFANMFGGLNSFMNPMQMQTQFMPQTMAATDQLIKIMNNQGVIQTADMNAPLLDADA